MKTIIKIIGQSDLACQTAKIKFQELINDLIKNDEISNETVQMLTKEQVRITLKLSNYFKKNYISVF